ncbi:MAG: hypothetical protein RL748_4285 [Pseudomonadota bacterium]|jgi:Fic family protein
MYDSPHQFEPVFPANVPSSLQVKAQEIMLAAEKLSTAAHASSRAEVRELVRSMNSYYSNRIEGQSTHPLNIERALRQDFSDRPDIARLQRVALAHIEAERQLELQFSSQFGSQFSPESVSPLSSTFLASAHHALYSRLAEADRCTEDGHLISPGAWRTEEVAVGQNIPPAVASLPDFFARLDQVYGRQQTAVPNWDDYLIRIACCHHRTAWVHPFRDGNGRAIRLQSHCALWPLSQGLWSPNRGLARAVNQYYAKLHNADQLRQGDFDGRGNLSTRALLEWIEFFLDICLDQVQFMQRMLQLDEMKQRISALITFRAAQGKGLRPEAILPLHHVFAAGPVTRGEFAQMTGLGERTARSLMSNLLGCGLLRSDTPLGPVRFGLPLDALVFLLPELYPEAATRVD